jgi:DNA-directed RNA polymerase subunit RPC12/RpoP
MKEVDCPRCRIKMEFLVEAELGQASKTIKYFYKCPACGTRILDQEVRTRRDNDKVVIDILR